jgi:hypothetical protein
MNKQKSPFFPLSFLEEEELEDGMRWLAMKRSGTSQR